MLLSIVPFLASVKGKALIRALFLRSLTAVPAWSDPVDGHRLKMAAKREAATDDVVTLETACKGRPGVIILLAPGTVVLDLDRKNGNDAVAWFEGEWGKQSNLTVVTTPTGGVHLWFSVPVNRHFPVRSNALAPGVDLLGTRGNVPMPGSQSARGAYELVTSFTPPPMPGALVKALSVPIEAEPIHRRPVVEARKTTAWGHKALGSYAAQITADGYVSRKLNVVAFVAGQRCSDISFADVSILIDAAVAAGMDAYEARKVVEDGWHAGVLNPKPPRPQRVHHSWGGYP